jgi:hypothetical protein
LEHQRESVLSLGKAFPSEVPNKIARELDGEPTMKQNPFI